MENESENARQEFEQAYELLRKFTEKSIFFGERNDVSFKLKDEGMVEMEGTVAELLGKVKIYLDEVSGGNDGKMIYMNIKTFSVY